VPPKDPGLPWPAQGLDVKVSMVMELAISLISVRYPEEFGQTGFHRAVRQGVGPTGLETLRQVMPSRDPEQSARLLAALKSLAMAPRKVCREDVTTALDEAPPEVAGFVAGPWWEAFAPVWADLEPRLEECAREARAAIARAGDAGATVDLMLLVPEFTGAPLLDKQARAIAAHTGATLTFVPSHFVDPSPGFFYGDSVSLILFSQPGWTFRTAKPGPAASLLALELARPLKTLADPTRLSILAHLGIRDMYTTELARVLGVTQPAISYHLKALKEAGLVSLTPSGAFTYARLEAEGLRRLGARVARLGDDRS
jgi:DNA-binding transcriptional ArsR family regulator